METKILSNRPVFGFLYSHKTIWDNSISNLDEAKAKFSNNQLAYGIVMRQPEKKEKFLFVRGTLLTLKDAIELVDNADGISQSQKRKIKEKLVKSNCESFIFNEKQQILWYKKTGVELLN